MYAYIVVTTIAGGGTAAWRDGTGTAASFNGPSVLAIDSNGVIYIPDVSNQRIRTMTGINKRMYNILQ
jgi:hypothetical protein